MRLLSSDHLGGFSLTKDLIDNIPAYAILSHTWGAEDDEVTFDDIGSKQAEGKAGYAKLQFCKRQAERDGLQYFWIDTCCINRANHAELAEAIISMYRWYRGAAKCYVYLSNVSTTSIDDGDRESQAAWQAAFYKSRWFTRGWTLQELLAPRSVEFFSHEGLRLGSKKTLEGMIHEITKIPLSALRGDSLSNFSVDERLRWALGRNTKRVEDKAYCLLGIFDVYMPTLYGEGDHAFTRLKEEIYKSVRTRRDMGDPRFSQANTSSSDDSSVENMDWSPVSVTEKLAAWLSPTNPKVHHERSNKCRTHGSGTWFLERESFKQWVSSGHGAFLWLRGISGAGKTTLMSAVIEELLRRNDSNTVVGYFYCSFDDQESQLPSSIFGSILAQLAKRSPELSRELTELYRERLGRDGGKPKPLLLEEMLDIIRRASRQYTQVYIAIDAVNEASEPLLVLETLRALSRSCTIIISSVNSLDFEQYLPVMPCLTIETIRGADIQDDVNTYIRNFLERHARMQGLPSDIKEEIAVSLTRGNNGMFRWVQCQLVRLAHLKTPGQIRTTLAGMPATLDSTYEGILSRVDEGDKDLVREVLLLLTFCLRPLSLVEICEALQITPGMSHLDKNKLLLFPMDAVSVCGGLVDFDEDNGIVSLAHHSVKTYLTNPNRQGSTAYFYLSEDSANQYFAEKCLTYLSFKAFASGPCLDTASQDKRKARFPFLSYAAYNWALHAGKVASIGPSLSIAMKKFFSSPTSKHGNFLAWVQVLLPEQQVQVVSGTPPLYYAASFGLTPIVEYLIDSGADLELHGGRFGATPLGIASYRGHVDVVKILVDRGASPYTPDNTGLSAVDWAVHLGRSEVFEVFKARGFVVDRRTELSRLMGS
ncbi:hypothetical protein PV08_04484 [Exophiala spinifera]|uniref:Uncharacterized protein n=1 Tax=Exophiala spinifera TaxID=91928 RepID=A0A0D2BE77_9EURO|nr:uncharacterized protein PV08_04484 [Exophiala spinifera]KIW17293.1 hypothetical protein PV08_04484 [Exophiala spinifera]